MYTRTTHFRKLLSNFCGRQQRQVPNIIYQDLDKTFKAWNLIVDNPELKYSKITKSIIRMGLKASNHSKHYKDINMIYAELTNKPKGLQLGELENQIIQDFERLILLYAEIYGKGGDMELDRKKFMSSHYVLFLLLRRHEISCDVEDFIHIPKTIRTRQWHDEICGNLFQRLGWSFTPICGEEKNTSTSYC